MAYYDEDVLFTLASAAGVPIKIDYNTLKVSRGKFVRVCVEIDLSKPMVGRVCMEGKWYRIEYEGLHIICSHGGCYGIILGTILTLERRLLLPRRTLKRSRWCRVRYSAQWERKETIVNLSDLNIPGDPHKGGGL